MERAFLTGCDVNTEWMLEWFLKNYRKHNDTPIVFADFGVSEGMRQYAMQMFDDYFKIDRGKLRGWFLKPKAMLEVRAVEACWLDTDIEILGDMSGIFRFVENNKLTMVEDKPWSKRMGQGPNSQIRWHNSGVVAFRNKPDILGSWERTCRKNPSRGDQETLHEMLSFSPLMKLQHIADAPNIYNWLRLQLENDGQDSSKKIAMHWTGERGKQTIRKKIYNG